MSTSANATAAGKSALDKFVERNPPTRISQGGHTLQKVQEPETFRQMLDKLGTKAGVIRYLSSLDKYSRNAIAAFTDSSYQYVRAVQLQDMKQQKAA